MTVVLLKAWTNDEYIEVRADFAIVDITPEFARMILDRMDVVESVKNALCIEWGSYAPDWYQWDEEIDGILDLGETIVLPSRPPITSEAVRQDVTRMRVYPHLGSWEARVKWEGEIKHTSVVIDTASIKRSTLEKIAE